MDLKSIQCGFDSHLGHYAAVAKLVDAQQVIQGRRYPVSCLHCRFESCPLQWYFLGLRVSWLYHGPIAQRQSRALITPWFQVRILVGPFHNWLHFIKENKRNSYDILVSIRRWRIQRLQVITPHTFFYTLDY